MPATSIHLAYEGLLTGMTIDVRRQRARTGEALLTDRTDVLLVTTIRVLRTEGVHHGCLVRIAIGTDRWLHHYAVITLRSDTPVDSKSAMLVDVAAVLVDWTAAR